MLNLASWLPLAEKLDLQPGRSRRVDHDCGPGRTLYLKREHDRLSAYCFRCGDSGSHRLEVPLAERIARLASRKAADLVATSTAELPSGLVGYSSWPVGAQLWFARAGLHAGDAGQIGAMYDPASERVILPCGPGFWQGRAVHPGQSPKYIAPVADKVYPRWGVHDRLVLVEDILSAYKIGQVVEAWCMLGTSLPSKLLAEILQGGRPVDVWLDNDPPPRNSGQIAARKIIKTLRGYGVTVRNIVTDKDPKLMTYESIRKHLCDA